MAVLILVWGVFNSLMCKHIYCLLTQSEQHIYIILQSKI